MAKKLKVYQASLGFFDLAVAASSMKAALQAWGAGSNLFHQGVARQSEDPDVVAAATARPGVVLRRPVGSDAPFGEAADLPSHLADEGPRTRKPRSRRGTGAASVRQAAPASQRARRHRGQAPAKREAAAESERARRRQAVATAQAALDDARREHDRIASAIDAERAVLERRAEAERRRWEKRLEKLVAALRRAQRAR